MESRDNELLVICIVIYCLFMFFYANQKNIQEYLLDSTDKEWREQHDFTK